MDFIRDFWSQIFVFLGAIVAIVKMNSLVQILRRDVDTLDKDLETVRLRAEVDQLSKNTSALWDHLNKLKDDRNK